MDPRRDRKPGFLQEATIDKAREYRKELKKAGYICPLRPLDCFLVMKRVEEQFNIAGWKMVEFEYDAEREGQYVVIRSGPGWRNCKGLVEHNVETGQVVPTGIKQGDLVQCLDRITQKVELNGETYWLVESHRILFLVD